MWRLSPTRCSLNAPATRSSCIPAPLAAMNQQHFRKIVRSDKADKMKPCAERKQTQLRYRIRPTQLMASAMTYMANMAMAQWHHMAPHLLRALHFTRFPQSLRRSRLCFFRFPGGRHLLATSEAQPGANRSNSVHVEGWGPYWSI